MHTDMTPTHRRTRRSLRPLCALTMTVAIAAGTALPASAAASNESNNKLTSALRAELSQYLAAEGTAQHFSADSLTVTFPGGGPGINLAAGTTTYGGTTPVSAYAPWQIGSNTKAFTSVILLQLEAEGRLSINDTLAEWLPQYPEWGSITIKSLLDMTSGIPDYSDQPAFLEAVEANLNTVYTAPQLLAYAYGLPLGTDAYAYTNSDYILAQMIIERATHDSYADQLTRRIIDPLHLTETCLAPETCRPSMAANMAAEYYYGNSASPFAGTAVPPLNVSFAQGAGGIVSSLPDEAIWSRALYRGLLLPPRQQRELESLISTTTSQPIATSTLSDPEGYGLGVAQITTPETGTVWYYEGATFGARVLHLYDAATGVFIVVAVNSDAGPDNLLSLAVSVFQTLQTGKTAAPASIGGSRAPQLS
jgi:D-alanyl-D-alanine carboxypeptidase